LFNLFKYKSFISGNKSLKNYLSQQKQHSFWDPKDKIQIKPRGKMKEGASEVTETQTGLPRAGMRKETLILKKGPASNGEKVRHFRICSVP
jgi:hypothetical protein